jgi:outer membrane protein assembly factor BamB
MRRPTRFCLSLSLCALALSTLAPRAYAQAGHPELIPETMARRHGLTRAWVTRVQVDPSRGRLNDVTLHEGTLIAVTDQATVQAIDAETGRTLWITNVGRRGQPHTPVGASASYVAACYGSTLYVIGRADGRVLFTRKMEGAPSAAAAVTEDRVYVPTFAGAIESYEINLDKPTHWPTTYRTRGIIEEAPVLAGNNLIWATSLGGVYSATKDNLTAVFRFMTRREITAGLGYWPPLVYAASADGYIYAIHEKTGKRVWQFSTNYPAREMPVPLDGNLYAISELSGMYCLSADKGLERWFTSNVAKLISASATRLYTADETGRLMVLDRRSGAHLDSMPTELLGIKVVNNQTDRLYLGTTKGMIQCLREIDQVTPLVHALPPDPTDAATPAGTKPAAAGEAPAAAGAAPAAEPAAEDPFGAEPPP